MAMGKTAKASPREGVGVRLSAFLLPEVAKMTCTDELHLEELGEKRWRCSAVSSTVKSLNYLVGLYTANSFRHCIITKRTENTRGEAAGASASADRYEAPNHRRLFLPPGAAMRRPRHLPSTSIQNMAQIKALFSKQ